MRIVQLVNSKTNKHYLVVVKDGRWSWDEIDVLFHNKGLPTNHLQTVSSGLALFEGDLNAKPGTIYQEI